MMWRRNSKMRPHSCVAQTAERNGYIQIRIARVHADYMHSYNRIRVAPGASRATRTCMQAWRLPCARTTTCTSVAHTQAHLNSRLLVPTLVTTYLRTFVRRQPAGKATAPRFQIYTPLRLFVLRGSRVCIFDLDINDILFPELRVNILLLRNEDPPLRFDADIFHVATASLLILQSFNIRCFGSFDAGLCNRLMKYCDIHLGGCATKFNAVQLSLSESQLVPFCMPD